MSFSGIGQLTTDVGEVVQVDECDIVDQRSRATTNEVTLEEEAPTTVGIGRPPVCTESLRRNTTEVSGGSAPKSAPCRDALRVPGRW